MERVDIAIVGAGPAGISAALNVKIRKKSFLLFGKKTLSNKVNRSERIQNYPGIPDIDGVSLNKRLIEQCEGMGIGVTPEYITGVYQTKDYFTLLAGQKMFEAKSVILTSGVETVRSVPGETEFLGRGVSYCATCDGMLYQGKEIAVVCDSRELEEEVLYLAELAKNVYFSPLYPDCTLEHERIKRLPGRVTAVNGGMRVESIAMQETTLAVDGIFFLKQSASPATLVHGLAMEEGHVVVDRSMATNIPGLFAAGDCTGRPYQIAKAAGEGNVAAHSAVAYLGRINENL